VNCSLAFDAKNGVICWRLEGNVVEEGFAESLRGLPGVVSGTEPKSGIIDPSKVTSFRVSTEALKRLAATRVPGGGSASDCGG